MGTKRTTGAGLALSGVLLIAVARADHPRPFPAPAAARSATPARTAPTAAAPDVGAPDPGAPDPGAGEAGAGEPAYAVGLRTLALARGRDRPLPTMILYPAAGAAAAGAAPVRGLPPAAGRFPLVLFSHGLHGSPAGYERDLVPWAAAGFVVAAPAYPHTSTPARRFDRRDIVHQPADAVYVIDRVRRLDRVPGDPLRGRIDGDRVAAVGHSAGGYTTTGLFTAGHDPRLRAGVVIAGWLAPGAFAGPPARLLFVHGGVDPVVAVADGVAAYDRAPWPKSFLLLPRSWHTDFLVPGSPGYREMTPVVTDFLRWTLDGDRAAGRRLPAGSRPAAGSG
jgi:dienelactone hydrolase